MRPTQPAPEVAQEDAVRESSATFPADEVVWGVAVRPGFDELDDPFYHRGLTQHAFLEGHDTVALCGFRPPLSGPRHRRRARLSLPSEGVNPMCGSCARRVVAPRSRVAVPVQPGAPPVAVPVAGGSPVTVAARVAPRALPPGVGAPAAGQPAQAAHRPFANEALPWPPAPAGAPGTAVPGSGGPQAPASRGVPDSPWVRRASTTPDGVSARGGLLRRGIRPDLGD